MTSTPDTFVQTPPHNRITARFIPQAWVNDYAVRVDGEYLFDVTDLLLSWPLSRVLAIRDHSYEADAVWREHSISEERPHDGPFEVEVGASIAEFLTKRAEALSRA